ncbi:hypothetical protein AB0M92_06785 [Streptomyces sp. NPDC051582]
MSEATSEPMSPRWDGDDRAFSLTGHPRLIDVTTGGVLAERTGVLDLPRP